MKTGLVALRIALAAVLLPLATGRCVVTYQDAVMTHLPAKAATVEQLREGAFPFLNPYASFGQPLAGNPNFGTFFPDMLLFVALPLPVAFGARFALAAMLAFVGARRWARAEGASRGAAEVAAWALLLSGVFVSSWRFFNTGLAVAVAPWVMAAAARMADRLAPGGRPLRRAAAELALWGGLEVLAGEPVVALLAGTLAAVRVAAGAWAARAHGAVASRRAAVWLGLAGLVAAAVAAPQIASTAQIYDGSTRHLAPFSYGLVTSTSLHPARLLEQATPYPFGRPDLIGEGGFVGHHIHDGHVPYLWTLHLGVASLALLVLFARPTAAGERGWWLAVMGALLLSLGRYLPGAKILSPLLSLDGRIRFPVKWWYVVALGLVPLVAHAARRWEDGEAASPPRRVVAAALAVIALAGIAVPGPTPLVVAAALVAALAVSALVWEARTTSLRAPAHLALLLVAPLALADAPLLLALVDGPPDRPPRFHGGRVLERLNVIPYPPPEVGALPLERRGREVYRRAARELWALTGALAGLPYAFDHDPDGIYFEADRLVGKAVDARPWDSKVPLLRAAGVEYVVTADALLPPYEEIAVLSPEHGVRLFRLRDPVASVRAATRTFPSGSPQEAVALQALKHFDLRSDAVILADSGSPVIGTPRPVHLDVVREDVAELSAHIHAPVPALIVWSRTCFPSAWRATVDGAPARIRVADGHLVGVEVPAGDHVVNVWWDGRPLALGAALAFAGLIAIIGLRR